MPKRSAGVTASGYRRVWRNGRLIMEHRLVWERERGPIPPGYVIHHINENKLDNRVENLACVTHEHHKRLHSGCVVRSGEWVKPCSVCGEYKSITDEHWYFVERRGWGRYPNGAICRPCHSARVVARRTAKRAARRTDAQKRRTNIARNASPLRSSGLTWREVASAVGWEGSKEGLAMLVRREVAAGRA